MGRKTKAAILAEKSIARWQKEGVDIPTVVSLLLADPVVKLELAGKLYIVH
jgi:hypothetical protein